MTSVKADRPRIVKRTWTEEEDQQLLDLVKIHGVKEWSRHGEQMEGRTGKQCRERYMNHLCQGIKKGDWTPEEDALIVEQQKLLGNQWAVITKMLPGRSDNAVKNRWHASQRHATGGSTMRAKKVPNRTYTDPNASMRSGGFRSHPLVPALSIPCLSPRNRTGSGDNGNSGRSRNSSRQFSSLNEAMMDMALHEHSHYGHGHGHLSGMTGRSDYDPNDPQAQYKAMVEAHALAQRNSDDPMMFFPDNLSPRSFAAPSLSPLDLPGAFFPEDGKYTERSGHGTGENTGGGGGGGGSQDPMSMSLNSLEGLFRGSLSRESSLNTGSGGSSRPNSTRAIDASSFNFMRNSFEEMPDSDPNFAGLGRSAAAAAAKSRARTGGVGGSGGNSSGIQSTSPGGSSVPAAGLNSLRSNISDSYYLSETDDADAATGSAMPAWGDVPTPNAPPPASVDRQHSLDMPAPAMGGRASSNSNISSSISSNDGFTSTGGSTYGDRLRPKLMLQVPDHDDPPQRITRGTAPRISLNDISPRSSDGQARQLPMPPSSDEEGMSDWFLSKVVLETLQHNTPRSPGNQPPKRTRRTSPRGASSPRGGVA